MRSVIFENINPRVNFIFNLSRLSLLEIGFQNII